MARMRQTVQLKGLPALRAKVKMRQYAKVRGNVGKRKA